ncbi:TetR/AcrR family transcriptional regulator [Microbacterium panaciterrae]|uniref:TetR/AcrR family transcriptional regulator n=2 Tax=Microbacterium panaciterrae TaxID=985759 RepID=A0ABP8PTG2_9MICO
MTVEGDARRRGDSSPVLAPQARRSRRVGRDAILDAAQNLFVMNGYAGTSTRDIADAVGIRQPSLYYHFKTKSDILREVLLETVEPAIATAHSLEDDTTLTPRQRLLSMVRWDVASLLQSSRRNQIYVMQLPEAELSALTEYRDRFALLRRLYRSFVAAARRDSTELPLSDEALANVIFSMIEAVSFRRIYEQESNPADIIEQTVHAVGVLIDR